MKRITKLDYDLLRDIYILSSSPNFLWRRFRSDLGVRSMAAELSSDELIEGFNEIITGDLENIDNKVAAYATMIALSLKHYSNKIRLFFGQIQEYQLEWINDLVALCLSQSNSNAMLESKLWSGKSEKIISSDHTTESHTRKIKPETIITEA
jgi:hypothetical protein